MAASLFLIQERSWDVFVVCGFIPRYILDNWALELFGHSRAKINARCPLILGFQKTAHSKKLLKKSWTFSGVFRTPQTSKIEVFTKIVIRWNLLTIFAKSFTWSYYQSNKLQHIKEKYITFCRKQALSRKIICVEIAVISSQK